MAVNTILVFSVSNKCHFRREHGCDRLVLRATPRDGMAALKRNEKILAAACRIETAIASVGSSSAARLARVWMLLGILLDEFIGDADCDQGILSVRCPRFWEL